MKMTNAEYHKAPGISKTGLDQIARSPAHYKAWLEAPPEEPTPQLLWGSAYHAMILQPNEYRSLYAIAPEVDRRSKAGKSEWEEFQASLAGRQVITRDMQETLNAMAKVLWSHELAMRLLSGGVSEDSLFTELSHCQCKARPDYKQPDVRALIDLKTANDAGVQAFSRAIANYRYHVQAAFYLDVCNRLEGDSTYTDFVFVAQEKSPPYAVAVYIADDDMVERGRQLYLDNLAVYRHCLDAGSWPGYPEKATVISLPRWATY